MSDFINTVDVRGDDVICDEIITKTLTEYADNRIASIGTYALYGCTKLTKADLPNAISISPFAFSGCSAMKTANLPLAEFVGNYAFNNCATLNSVNIPLVTTINNNAFNGCGKLVSIDMPSATLISGKRVFYRCSALTAVILRSKTVCKLDNVDSFTQTPIASATGYIYVPAALVESYREATNWSAYGSQFRAIEDYPDVTGG